MLSINTNFASMAANNALGSSNASLSKSMERLATGLRINSSADDAAGKQIANRLQAQSSGMGVAQRNIADATALLQTADGTFDEMNSILSRMKDTATQAANGTYSDEDRQAMQSEFDQLGQEMSDMLQNTTYGGTDLFSVSSSGASTVSGLFADKAVTFQVGSESSDTMSIDISSELGNLTSALGTLSASFKEDQTSNTMVSGTELMTASGASAAIDAIQGVMADVGKIQSVLGASINRLGDTANNLQSMQDNTAVAVGNIMDTDYATEASNMSKNQVLMQTSITMLKQSNSMSGMVSSLLQ